MGHTAKADSNYTVTPEGLDYLLDTLNVVRFGTECSYKKK